MNHLQVEKAQVIKVFYDAEDLEQIVSQRVQEYFERFMGECDELGRFERYVGIGEISKMTGWKRNTIYKKVQRGTLPCVKVGKSYRFDRVKVMRCLRENHNEDVK